MAEQRKVRKLAGVIVEHQEHLAVLSDEDAQWAIQNTVDAIALFCEAVKNRTQKIVEKLLEPFGEPFSTPSVKEFVAKKKFVRDTSENTRVRISWLGENFKRVMLPKTERDIAECELKFKKLRVGSFDAPIIVEMGGEEKAEVSLCEFYETLAHKQAIRDFSWIVGYVRDVDNVLWAVDADWYDGGWNVGANSLGDPRRWRDGYEFVSR